MPGHKADLWVTVMLKVLIGIIGKVYFLPFSNGNNFYMYDPLTNTWTMKATFPGLQRQGAIVLPLTIKDTLD